MFAQRKLMSDAILVLLLMSAFSLVIHISSENTSAAPDAHTWDGGGADAFAGTHLNWVSDVAPTDGDSVIFNAGVLPCTWNLSIALNTWSMTAAYTGVVTQSESFSVSSFSITSGTFTGSASKTVSCGGSFTVSGSGILTNAVTNLIFTGDGTLTTLVAGQSPLSITISANVTVATTVTLNGNLNIDVNRKLTIGANIVLTWKTYVGGVFTNNGEILAGGANSALDFLLYDNNPNLPTMGAISCALWLENAHATASSIVTATSSITLGTILRFIPGGTGTITLDLSTGNYPLSANGITIGTRGILNGSASTISSSGNIDFSAGQFNANRSSLVMTGTGKTIKTANTDGAPYNLTISGTVSTLSSLNVTNNLIIDAGKSLTMGSGMSLSAGNISSAGSLGLSSNTYTLYPLVNTGSIVQGSNRLNISGSSTTPLTGYGTFDGSIYLNGSAASSYQVQTALPMGDLYFDRDTKISLDSTRYLQAVPSTTEFISTSIKSIGTEAGYAARWDATSTGPVTYTVTVGPNQLYDIWVDHTTRIGVYQTGPDGILQFTYNGPFSTHTFTISKSGGPPNNLQAAFEYTLDGNMVSFTEKSYGGAVVWIWNFGDGYGSTEQNPTHQYTSAGTYQISLTVYDSEGRSSTAKTTIKMVLGPDNPIGRGDSGWDVYISDQLTLSISAIGLIVGGAIMYVSAIFLPYFPIITPKGRKILGAIMVVAGVYYFIFIDNNWWG